MRLTEAPSTNQLRSAFHGVVRRFGPLSGDRTPCGHRLPVSHAHALMSLLACEHGGVVPSQSTLVQHLGIDKSNVSRVCRSLVGSGHVRERPALHDRRVRELSLTARGRKLASAIDTSSRRRFDQLVAHVPSAQVSGVIQALQVLEQAIEAMDAEEANR